MIPVVLILLMLIVFLVFRKTGKPPGGVKQKALFSRCPVCGSELFAGERVYSHAYSHEDSKIIHVKGCSHCLDGHRSRHCPVCRKKLGKEDFLAGKMWQGEKKARLHLSGCNHCLKIK